MGRTASTGGRNFMIKKEALSNVRRKFSPEKRGNVKTQKSIRYAVVSFGIGLMAVVVILNIVITIGYEEDRALFWLVLNFPSFVLLSIWNILPHLVYFKVTRKIYSYYILLTPAFLLCSVQLFFIATYFASLSSTSGLIFIFAPIYEGIALAIGFPLGALVEKIKNKVVKDKKVDKIE